MRGRPPGSINKPKFISISLRDLTSKFSPDTLINIDSRYAFMFENCSKELDFDLPTVSKKQKEIIIPVQKIEVKKVDLFKE